MCATRHRAFDAHLFRIEPEPREVRFVAGGPSARGLRIEVGSLAGLEAPPCRSSSLALESMKRARRSLTV